MLLVLVVLAAALAVGWLRGGSLERLGSLPLRSRRLVVGALVAQLAGSLVGGPFHPVGLVVSAGLVVAFLARNRGIRGTGLVALGLVANAVVVAANGAMPVSAHAAGRAGVGIQDLLTGADARHELAGPSTRLRELGDVVPVPFPVRPEVVSAGDVLIAAGLGQLVVLAMVGAGATDRAPRPAAGPDGRDARKGRPRRALPPLPAWTSAARPSATPPARRPARLRPPAGPPRSPGSS